MTDYKKSTGSSGTMMIRDTGTTVSFMINSGNDSTHDADLPWGYTVNGTTNNSRTSNYSAGAGWVTLGSWTVSTDQTVTFRLYDTGTSGLGGPTTLSVSIDRASIPYAPSPPTVSGITATTAVIKVTDANNGGAAIDSRQIGYGTSSVSIQHSIATSGTSTITGLTPGTVYYAFARTHNAKGYSGWSDPRAFTTINIPDATDAPIVSDPTQTSFVVSYTDNGNGGSAILERQIGYSVGFVSVQHSVEYTGVMTIDGLLPATTYYVWSRSRNAAGWGAYSSPAVITTIAGAYVQVSNVWKQAVPYVNVSGVWKLARPWGRVAGEWQEST